MGYRKVRIAHAAHHALACTFGCVAPEVAPVADKSAMGQAVLSDF
jgi:hypothetical protein